MPAHISVHRSSNRACSHTDAEFDTGHKAFPKGKLLHSYNVLRSLPSANRSHGELGIVPLMIIIESNVTPEDPSPSANLEPKSCLKSTLIAL